MYDEDGDEKIAVSELRGMMETLGLCPDEHSLQLLVASMDADDSKEITFDEFALAVTRHDGILTSDRHLSSQELAEAIFNQVDQDKTGEISVDNLQSFFQKYFRGAMSVDEIAHLVHEVDQNGDGVISKKEFIKLLERYQNADIYQ